MSITFDPVQFKTTTRAQWEAAADAWNRWGPTIESWLGSATETMLDDAAVTTGGRVLDVAAGAGGQTLAAARRVGPGGEVLATDISPAILGYAQQVAQSAGMSNINTLVADGEDLSEVEAGAYDVAISRVGLIYFPDQQAALAGMCRALRPGGRVSAVVYSTADRNGFFSIPVGIIRRRAELPPPLPGQPGPFSLGSPGVAEEVFTKAGLTDITVTTVPSPVRMRSAAECVQFERESFGALHQMLSGLDETGRAEAWAEITEQLAQFEGPNGFEGPCEMLVVTGTK
ncbi:class I SAM-dependent methyltransferase [Aeromicrobium ginsengisoli]|uniref:Class I SAM-dependent methyltransferase n=1 Tax=Aeromicrobium ginsengisoli TaxID=363867 RepID=A0A5M4FI99_9ACTN|nr:class I SAM-dependent methyltransferase [Aeromicrobium ginsengisoli]KAA1399315.1 class I SAM-dependent methyltransferase [Aeromicrobium ginsengisoli]